MSLLSYQLQIKKYLRELGLSDRDFNKLDVKHSDVNLIKQLKLLNPVASGPPAPTGPSGWYGDFIILNSAGSTKDIFITIEADTNGTIVELYATETIQPDNFIIVSVSQQNRLTNPSTLIKVSYQVDEGGIITNNFFTGLTLTNSSSSIYNLTVDSGFINGQNIDWEFITATPPNPTASITTTNANITPGQSTTLTPVFSNATTVTIDGSTTTPSGGAIINNTAFSVSPNVSKTYLLVATNSVGVQATASVTINVGSVNTGFYGQIRLFNKRIASNGPNRVPFVVSLYAINNGVQTDIALNKSLPSLFTNPSPPLPNEHKVDIPIGSRLLNANTQIRAVATFNTFWNFFGANVTGGTALNAPGYSWVAYENFVMNIDANQLNNGIITIEYMVA